MKVLTQKNITMASLVFFSYKLVCVDNKFTNPIAIFRVESAAYEFIEAILKEYEYCKKVVKKQFNKNLIMSEKEEE